MFNRYRVWDGICEEYIPGTFKFRKNAVSLRDAVRFQYILFEMKNNLSLGRNPDFYVIVEKL